MVYSSSGKDYAFSKRRTSVRIRHTLQNIIGMDYGDSRVCKTLAGEFESLASHQMLLSSNGRTPASQADVNAGSIPVKSTESCL